MPDTRARDLRRAGVRAVVRRTYHAVIRHRVLDSAASLTFFALLTVFPTALTVVSVLAVVDRAGDSVADILDVLAIIVRPETAEHFETPLRQLLTIDNPWLGATIGLVLTLWSLSGYATAFGRAMNVASSRCSSWSVAPSRRHPARDAGDLRRHRAAARRADVGRRRVERRQVAGAGRGPHRDGGRALHRDAERPDAAAALGLRRGRVRDRHVGARDRRLRAVRRDDRQRQPRVRVARRRTAAARVPVRVELRARRRR
jgi:hypothetical protein